LEAKTFTELYKKFPVSKHHKMKVYKRGREVKHVTFWTSALDEGEWPVSHIDSFASAEGAPGTLKRRLDG
jgi:hypothetical protein